MPLLQLDNDEVRAALLVAFTDKFPEHTAALAAEGLPIEIVVPTRRLDGTTVVETEVPEIE
jgi:hypothetical protein